MVDSVNGGPGAGRTSPSLDERLLQTALEQLREEPAERLSLRRVAQQLDVSHQAPYVHFGTKRRFLAAVAGTGLRRAAATAAAAVEAAGPDPLHRLHALADAYVRFVRDNPHVHDLAYGPTVDKADHPRLQQAAADYWELLHDTVAACQPAGIDEADVLRRCAAAWGTVYGIARLAALHQIPASVPADRDALLHEALDMLHRGWQARD
ncbi:TetR/AcrR family transcriptional regulator [Rhodococcus sp. A5(2022)]|uniref:TetR/AcrR family transcriptional regulator n=1 Tax=Rhodococcus sp. A5(2022) TaxID=3003588 RepID=UPI0022A87A13|nr:TetR/AcrR family transcriptional regulator [Rhodococcus sp. A5(2022)]MCZ1071234.1 WHG domain-containing protein [Rhodococcus sp. A5(2022)]